MSIELFSHKFILYFDLQKKQVIISDFCLSFLFSHSIINLKMAVSSSILAVFGVFRLFNPRYLLKAVTMRLPIGVMESRIASVSIFGSCLPCQLLFFWGGKEQARPLFRF